MPSRVADSFAVACNKGGVGKSTTVAQIATQYAAEHRDCNVLILDLTVTGNVSSLLFSSEGLSDVKTTGDFLQKLSQYSKDRKKAQSWWPSRQWLRKDSFDWKDIVTWARDVQPSSQPNLYVTRGGKDIRKSLNCDNWKDMVTAFCRSADVDIEIANEKQWVLFFDTDQSVFTSHAQFALSCAKKVIAPLELDQLDFDRLFEEDDEEPGLFHVLSSLAEEAAADKDLPSPARFHKLIFTKVQKKTWSCMDNPDKPCIPFTPPQAELDTMGKLANILLQKRARGEVPSELFVDEVSDADFAARYFTAIPVLAVTPLSVSKNYALPFADIDIQGSDGAIVQLPKGLPEGRPNTIPGFTNQVVHDNKAIFQYICQHTLG